MGKEDQTVLVVTRVIGLDTTVCSWVFLSPAELRELAELELGPTDRRRPGGTPAWMQIAAQAENTGPSNMESFRAGDLYLQRVILRGHLPLEDPAIPMIINCPICHGRHIDVGEFATKRHHTHACQHCGHCWRPSVVPTIGVQFLPGFKDEEAEELCRCGVCSQARAQGRPAPHNTPALRPSIDLESTFANDRFEVRPYYDPWKGRRIHLTKPISSRRNTEYVHGVGTEGVVVMSLGENAWVIEVMAHDSSLVGEAWHETLDVHGDEFCAG